MTDLEVHRRLVVDRLRRELVGPAGGVDEVVIGRPSYRYLTGMLFPKQASHLLEADHEEEDEVAGTSDASDAIPDTALAAAYDLLPASMGVSFYVEGAVEIRCRAFGARYEQISSGSEDGDCSEEVPSPDEGDSAGSIAKLERWRRRSLADPSDGERTSFVLPQRGRAATSKAPVFGGAAIVSLYARPLEDGHLVTMSLVNEVEVGQQASTDEEIGAILFQAAFEASVEQGAIGAYPRIHTTTRHPEDDELALTYRKRRSRGVGHGCAATWAGGEGGGAVRRIRAECLPEYVLKGLTNEVELPGDASKCVDIAWLAKPDRPREDLAAALDGFVDAYESWTEGQVEASERLSRHHAPAAARILARQCSAVARMRRGVAVLRSGPTEIADSFRLAQAVMLEQFEWRQRCADGPHDLGEGRLPPESNGEAPSGERAKWFPFQLAFQLLVLEPMVNGDSIDRSVVDLLWFPTGGGKTEAYLALAAMEMIRRRLVEGDGGTAVLMRYTLRLLTAQQFERCATMVAVLEQLRERESVRLGDEPFRLGLWVGGELTPNRLDHENERQPGARQRLEALLEDERPENPFLLRGCPSCGTRLVPTEKAPRAHYGLRADARGFRFHCPESRCVLHDEIPASVVDQDLFLRPPTMLIGTVDKFARMTWDEASRVFLGCGDDERHPPSLVIQDELHLINGPLGSIAGVYEAGIEAVLRDRGTRPKYVASTATIQRASEQCRALYGRDAFVFPPSGLDATDSFYSREDERSPGRLYLGLMGNGQYSSLTALVQTAAAAAQAPLDIPADEILSRDSYWTQVIYHNSKQELGKTMTVLRDDVRTRLEMLEPDAAARRSFELLEELSANIGSAVGESLERIEVALGSAELEDVIDAVACTNMISVGVDVSRLGLMLVKGQPKSSAEYIQATSRVGRDWRRRPAGIVLTIYNPLRPRDRSHFETFQSFHQALYLHVEPSSVTPFSSRARARTLHAALVLGLRSRLGWTSQDAARFDPDSPEQQSLITHFRQRLLEACPEDERADLVRDLDSRIEEWRTVVGRDDDRPLTFSGGRQFRTVLAQFSPLESARPPWPTLNSMRHVDGETPFVVRGVEEVSDRG